MNSRGRLLVHTSLAGDEEVEPLAASINDTATTLGVGRTTVYALIRAGRLQTVKIGRRHLVKTDSTRRLLDGK